MFITKFMTCMEQRKMHFPFQFLCEKGGWCYLPNIWDMYLNPLRRPFTLVDDIDYYGYLFHSKGC